MKVYHTLSGQKEEFVPQDDEVKMYVCGINAYADSHIGHALSYIFFDVVRRYLEFRGYKVKHVVNVTDIEDNIIATANRLGIPVMELTEKYTERYFEDMAALNVLEAHIYPRATEEIPKIIEIVEGLIDKGFAYPSKGNVYFRVSNVPDYGKLSNRNLESMVTGTRIEPEEGKEHPADFVLWKVSKPGEPKWESPWGEGRPGWHIECSAMSLRYLGEMIDIHGGGQDLVFPHHENEIVQSESFTGKKPFVKYWMHNGMLQLDEEKMSKSVGNLVTIREALEKHSADAIRVFILGSYYRSPLSYSEEALEAAEKGADRLRQVVVTEDGGGKSDGQIDVEAYRNRFIEAMDDDFGTPQALSSLFDLVRDINRFSDEGINVEAAKEMLTELAGVLGLTLEPRHQISGQLDISKIADEEISQMREEKLDRLLETIENTVKEPDPEIEVLSGYVNLALAVRNALREAKQYQRADEIRNRLTACGFIIKDTASSPRWVYEQRTGEFS
ncbi:MAG: cysteine--tRNA ligase [Dehalococcoidales bacterium]